MDFTTLNRMFEPTRTALSQGGLSPEQQAVCEGIVATLNLGLLCTRARQERLSADVAREGAALAETHLMAVLATAAQAEGDAASRAVADFRARVGLIGG